MECITNKFDMSAAPATLAGTHFVYPNVCYIHITIYNCIYNYIHIIYVYYMQRRISASLGATILAGEWRQAAEH